MESSKDISDPDSTIKPRLLNTSKSICNIKILKPENSPKIFSGFLFKFIIEPQLFYYLVINEDIMAG